MIFISSSSEVQLLIGIVTPFTKILIVSSVSGDTEICGTLLMTAGFRLGCEGTSSTSVPGVALDSGSDNSVASIDDATFSRICLSQ